MKDEIELLDSTLEKRVVLEKMVVHRKTSYRVSRWEVFVSTSPETIDLSRRNVEMTLIASKEFRG